jgi:hypothetical protein
MPEINKTFKILFCSDNESAIQSIPKKIKDILTNIPYELKIVRDGIRAINEIKNNYQLFVVDSNPVGIDVFYLLKNYHEVMGGGTIIVLNMNDLARDQFENCDVINWPISAWNEFEETTKSSIPEELKIKYGLGKILPASFQILSALTAQYQQHNSFHFQVSEALVIMPANFFEVGSDEIKHSIKDRAVDENVLLLGENTKKYSLMFEIIFLSLLTGYNIYILNRPDYDSDSFYSTRVLITILTSFVFFALVSNWTLRRYIIRITKS